MKKFVSLLLLSLVAFSACSIDTNPSNDTVDDANQTSVPGVFVDDEYGVTFNYPETWEMRQTDNYTLFAANFDYLDGLAESSASTEREGTLAYSVIENPDGLSLQAYYDKQFDECMAQEVDPRDEFGPMCENLNFVEWSKREVNGNESFTSDWKGIPNSGEQQKRLIVDLKDQKLFVVLEAVRTGSTDQAAIEATSKDAFESLEVLGLFHE